MNEEFSTKGQRQFSEERIFFSTGYAGKFGLPCAKNKSFDPYLVLFMQREETLFGRNISFPVT